MRLIVGLFLLAAVMVQSAQACDISGNVPAKIRDVICQVAASVNGGAAPVNQLTLVLQRAPAAAVAIKNIDAKNFLLTLLDTWKNGRGVRVARVEAYYERVHLATAKTNGMGAPSVSFH